MILGCSMELLTEIILVAENNRYRWSNKHKIWFQWIGHITKVLWDNRCSWIGRNKSLIAQKIAKLKKVFFFKKKKASTRVELYFPKPSITAFEIQYESNTVKSAYVGDMNIISGLCFYTAYHLTLFEVGDENKKNKIKETMYHKMQGFRKLVLYFGFGISTITVVKIENQFIFLTSNSCNQN